MSDALEAARAAIADRMARFGDSPFYLYAAKEMARIDDRLTHGLKPDRAFYNSLIRGLGLMCTRELDASDPEFCKAMDNMLEDIRLQTL